MSVFSVQKWRAILDAIEWFRDFCRRNDAAISRLAAIEQDARRYRFLRDEHEPGPLEPRAHVIDQQQDTPDCRFCHGAELDAAVDAALSCPRCHGTRRVTLSNYDGNGSDADDQPCPECK